MRQPRSVSRLGLRVSFALVLSGCGADPFGGDEAVPDDAVALPPSSAAATAESTQTVGAASAAAPAEPDPKGSERFIAVVQVSKEKAEDDEGRPRRMVFSGVTLQPENRKSEARPGFDQIVASYSQSAVWRALDGKRVSVLAMPYHPEGRAIAGDHMDVLEARLVEQTATSTVIGFGRQRKLEGAFREHTIPAGQKASGEKVLYFDVKGGASYEIFDGFRESAERPKMGEPMTIEAHEVDLSKFMQRRGGPFLWVRRVPPRKE